jgi:hypothetical protein
MPGASSRIIVNLAAIAVFMACASLTARHSFAHAISQAGSSGAIACRVLEIHETANSVLVIFHQRDVQDRDALGKFLQAHTDGAAQFQSMDGAWHDATVFRIKSCFGRGLLVFPAGAAKINDKDTFALRAASQ